MSASNHVNPYQMKLFYDAEDLMNMRANDSKWDEYEPLSEHNQPIPLSAQPSLIQQKNEESDGPVYYDDDTDEYAQGSLRQSIATEGIKTPVRVTFLPTGEPILMNGHHRTVVAHGINPHMVVPTNLEDPRAGDNPYGFMQGVKVDPSYYKKS